MLGCVGVGAPQASPPESARRNQTMSENARGNTAGLNGSHRHSSTLWARRTPPSIGVIHVFRWDIPTLSLLNGRDCIELPCLGKLAIASVSSWPLAIEPEKVLHIPVTSCYKESNPAILREMHCAHSRPPPRRPRALAAPGN